MPVWIWRAFKTRCYIPESFGIFHNYPVRTALHHEAALLVKITVITIATVEYRQMISNLPNLLRLCAFNAHCMSPCRAPGISLAPKQKWGSVCDTLTPKAKNILLGYNVSYVGFAFVCVCVCVCVCVSIAYTPNVHLGNWWTCCVFGVDSWIQESTDFLIYTPF